MLDNDLIRLIIPIIQTGLTNDGYTGVIVKQSNQPTLQGANTGPTIYFFKLFDKRYGFPKKQDTWDPVHATMVHTEIELYETSFQVGALVQQNPMTPYAYTASDLVNEVSAILQSDYAITTLANSGVGLLRITDVRNPYFNDDRDQFEASPNFDFTLTHRQTRVSSNPVVDSTNTGLYPI